MPDLSGTLGQVINSPEIQGLTYLRYMSWQDLVSNASLFSKVLFVAALFVLVLFLGLVRRKVFHLTMNGAVFGLVMGVILVLGMEAALVVGGKVVIGGVGGESGQVAVGELVRVLGVTGAKGPEVVGGEKSSSEKVLQSFVELPASEAAKVYEVICK